MLEFIEALLKYVATPTIIAVVIGWVFKTLMEKFLEKRFEAYKKELDNLSLSYQIKFTSLHEERRIILKELFEKILDIEQTMLNASITIEVRAGAKEAYEFVNEVYKKINDLSKFVSRNEIYFDETFCNKLKEFVLLGTSHIKKIAKASRVQAKGEFKFDQKILEEAYDLYTTADNDLHKKLIEIKKELVKDFREYLGVG